MSREPSPNLDLVRAVAVVMVVQAHVLEFFGTPAFWAFQPSLLGRLGVVLFFVHTSLVLMLSLDRQGEEATGKGYLPFLIRRAFRIFPLSVAWILAAVAFDIPQHLNTETRRFEHVGRDPFALVANLLLVQNFVTGRSIQDPLWSLPYEFQMYLILPVLYVVARRLGGTNLMVGVWAVVFLGVMVARPRYLSYNARLPLLRVPDLLYMTCFLPGVIAYQSWANRRRTLPAGALPALLAMVGLCWFFSYDEQKFAVVALIVGVALPQIRELEVRWLCRACHLVATYSYGAYLSHYFCIWLAFERLGGHPAWVRWAVFASGMVGLPVALYHAIEAPMIRLGNHVAREIVARRRITPAEPGQRRGAGAATACGLAG